VGQTSKISQVLNLSIPINFRLRQPHRHFRRPIRCITDKTYSKLSDLSPSNGATSTCPYLDERDANSSIPIAPSSWPSRIRDASCGFPKGTHPIAGFRGHPSCDNPCGLYRKSGPERCGVRAAPIDPLAARAAVKNNEAM
jgi:hypothetical protein